jgi:hypothetical protein
MDIEIGGGAPAIQHDHESLLKAIAALNSFEIEDVVNLGETETLEEGCAACACACACGCG